MLTGPQNSAPQFASGLLDTRKRIASAAMRYRRDPATIELLAVSKQQPVDVIRAVAAAGQRAFGENYVQEALVKIEALAQLDLEWHFIGQLQANKTRAVAEHFHWVHTVDRERIARRLSEQRPGYAPPLRVCLQVSLEDEPGKGGAAPEELLALARLVAALPRLELRGLMCIPPPREQFDEQRALFRRVADCASDLRRHGLPIDTLSMGMTADLEAAIAEGATIVRIGTAIFGPRN